MRERVRVLVAEGDEFYTDAFSRALQADAGIEVVGAVNSFEHARDALGASAVCVVLLDMHLPGLGSLRDAGRLGDEHPGLGIVLIGLEEDVPSAAEFVLSNPSGRAYLSRLGIGSAERLGRIVHMVAEGSAVLDWALMRQVRAGGTGKPSGLGSLTARELEVLGCVARGESNSAIAHGLRLSPRTVENHVGTIFSKLNVRGVPDIDPRVAASLRFLAATGRLRSEGERARDQSLRDVSVRVDSGEAEGGPPAPAHDVVGGGQDPG